MLLFVITVAGLLLAYANGANDNFKGVATLLGSETTSYRRALALATVTTACGSLASLILAQGLLAAFTGKGIVPGTVAADPRFALSVALAAGATVLLATRIGFPISTTHALIGGLVGAAVVASPTGVDTTALGRGFLLPLLTSPFLALMLSAALYPPLRYARRRLGVTRETCVCIGTEVIGVVPESPGAAHALAAVRLPTIAAAEEATCRVRYQGRVLGVRAPKLLDAAHYVSAGAVSFARGLNDTPKVAALLLVGHLVAPGMAITAVGFAIAVGGLLSARRVAQTMAHGVTDMNPGQGFTANIVTSLLVIGASRFGVPVSTTHVSCGALFGIGSVTKQANSRTIAHLLLAWVITLPMAAAFGAGVAAITMSA